MTQPPIPSPSRDLRAHLDHARAMAANTALPIDERRQWAAQVDDIEASLTTPQTETLWDLT